MARIIYSFHFHTEKERIIYSNFLKIFFPQYLPELILVFNQTPKQENLLKDHVWQQLPSKLYQIFFFLLGLSFCKSFLAHLSRCCKLLLFFYHSIFSRDFFSEFLLLYFRKLIVFQPPFLHPQQLLRFLFNKYYPLKDLLIT